MASNMMALTNSRSSEAPRPVITATSKKKKEAEAWSTIVNSSVVGMILEGPSHKVMFREINPKESHFLCLPQELRDMIYSHLFEDESELQVLHPLTRVCQSTRSDASGILIRRFNGHLELLRKGFPATYRTCWWEQCHGKCYLCHRHNNILWLSRPNLPEYSQKAVVCCYGNSVSLQLTVLFHDSTTMAARTEFHTNIWRLKARPDDLYSFLDECLVYECFEVRGLPRNISCHRVSLYEAPSGRGQRQDWVSPTHCRRWCTCCPRGFAPSMFIDKVASWPTSNTLTPLPWISRAVAEFYTCCRFATRKPQQ